MSADEPSSARLGQFSAAPEPAPKLTRAEAAAILGILVLAAFVRLYGLGNQGIRTSDGGHYAHQAWKVLQKQPEAIKDKPGHTLLIMLAFNLLGVEMSSPLYQSAVTGLLFVILLWLGVRHWYGVGPGLLTALMAAIMPYLLFYHRDANSDGNVLTFTLAGILAFGMAMDLFLRANMTLWPKLAAFLAAGVVFGLALSTNYSMATTFVPACLALALRAAVNRKQALSVSQALLALLLGLAAGYLFIVWIMWPYTKHEELWRQIAYHQTSFLRFCPSLRELDMLVRYVGVAPLLLAAAGLWQMWRRRAPFDVFGLVLAAFMVLAYSRSVQPYPRVYVHLCLPLLLACGAGFRLVLDALADRVALGRTAIACILAATFAQQAPGIVSTVTLRSGYPEACRTLISEGDRFRMGGATHTWWTLEAFTGRRFGYCSEVLAKDFAADDWESAVLSSFGRWRRQGFTHIVLDYHLWNRMSSRYNDRFAAFLKSHPPAWQIPNPAARHHQTIAEDGGLPEAGANPLSEFIYIYRLKDFGVAASE